MKKDYQAPEVEIISLIAQEPTTKKSDLDSVEGDLGTASSVFD